MLPPAQSLTIAGGNSRCIDCVPGVEERRWNRLPGGSGQNHAPVPYDSSLAHVFRQSDNLLVNKEIIRQGYGYAYTKYPFDPARMEECRAAEREARENKRGLWGPQP
jgi:hypothetical protein